MQRLEGEILELPLQLVDAQAVRERCVDLERLARLLHLLLAPEVLERAHVVEPVGELDQDDPDVMGHRHDHLSVVLGLRVLAALELDPRQLRDALDERRDLLAELGAHLVDSDLGVLDDVVEERGRDRLVVEPQLRADLRGAERVVDEGLARAALLARVRARREIEGPREQVAVDVVVVVVGRDLGHQLFEEVFVSFPSVDQGHAKIVVRTPPVTVLPVSPAKDSALRDRRDAACAQTTPQKAPRSRVDAPADRAHGSTGRNRSLRPVGSGA